MSAFPPIPDFRMCNTTHPTHIVLPELFLMGQALTFAFGMEGISVPDSTPRRTVGCNAPATVLGWPHGVNYCTLYGEPALHFNGWCAKTQKFESRITVTEDPSSIATCMEFFGFKNKTEHEDDVRLILYTVRRGKDLPGVRLDMYRITPELMESMSPEASEPEPKPAPTPYTHVIMTSKSKAYSVPQEVYEDFVRYQWAAHAAMEWAENSCLGGVFKSQKQFAQALRKKLGL